MIEIDGKTLPEPVLKALQDTLDNVPAKVLLDYSRPQADLMKGLSPRPDSAPVLRKRLKAQLLMRRPLDPTFLELLREGSLFGQLIVVLSDKALAHGFPAFCGFFGEAFFLAGLLLDPREEVRKMAWAHLEAHPAADGFREWTPETARQTLESDFGPFLSRMASLKVKLPGPQDKAPDSADVADLRVKLRHFEEQAKREDRAAEKEKNTLAREREQHRAKVDELDSKIRELKGQITEAEARAKAAERTLAEAQDDLHRRVREGVAAELTSESRRWLLPLREMEHVARTHKQTASLLNDVREAIRQQADRDRAMGNRHELRKRLDALRQAREEVREALKNALNRHPRLGELAESLDREIEQLGALLGEPAVAGGAENALFARVNLAQSVAEVEAVRAFLEGDAKTFNLFAPGFTQELGRRIADKRHQLLQNLMPAAAPGADKTPSDLLRHKLALPNVRLLLVIDGHNLLLSHPGLFQPWLENGQPGAKAREELVKRLAAALAPSREVDIRLYFDGPERSEIDRTPRLKIIYSGGGQGDQRADNAIVQDLEFYVARYEGCFLATDDSELLERALRPGVQGRSLNQLADLIADS